MVKKVGIALVSVLVLIGIWQWRWVSYGWMQASGQLSILWNARPVSEVLTDPAVPDSLKIRLRLVQEIRRFAIDSLGLNDTESYQSFYDQRGKPILWVLTAAEPYKIKAVDWQFPLIGSFTYIGYFDQQRALRAKAEMAQKGYDTDLGEVAAWSTLGYFNDPILSGMLSRQVGRLASLIIHEMTHSTLFVKDSHEFNENLANFVGDYGAVRFLAMKYGVNSVQTREYAEGNVFSERYIQHINRGTRQLDNLYGGFRPETPVALKDSLKITLIRQIVRSVDTLYRDLKTPRSRRRWRDQLPNNAYFVGFATYNAQRNQFEEAFRNQFGGDFRKYLLYLKTKYPSL
ncbi:MAG: aminopeptidase [Cytophagaceae bacterium]|nr:aminopeptidase [Cytophagaceae bacterium]